MSRADLDRELDTWLAGGTPGDREQEMELLRLFKNAAVLRVAASDVAGEMPLMRVSKA